MAIDYTLQSPLAAVAQGLNIGAAMNQAQAANAQSTAAAERAQSLSRDISGVFSKENPQAVDFAQLTLKYPEMNKEFKQSWEMLDTSAQQGRLQQASTVYAALEAGRPEIAINELRTQSQAAGNSGDQVSADAAATMADLIEQNPNVAKTAVGLRLATMMGPDKFTETFTKLQSERRAAELQPSKLTESQAKAQKAAVDAKFAESMAVQDLQKKGWEIAKLEADTGISRQNSRIAAINAQIARETKADKIQELQQKVQNAQLQRDESVRMKADEAQGSADTLNMVSGLLGDLFEDEDSLRAATGTGAFRGAIPGTKARSTAGKIAQLQDVLASANLDKLKGPMSDKDIEFVRRLGSSLDRYQNEEKFIEELKRLNGMLPGTMDKLNAKYGSSFSLMKNAQGIEDATGAPPPGAVRRIR